MRSGALDRVITIERKATEADPEYVANDSTYGTDNSVWLPLAYQPGSPRVAARFRAEWQDVLPSRDEGVAQTVATSSQRARVRMRWRNDIDSSMRVTRHGGDDLVYQIVSEVAEIEGRKQRIEFMVERTKP